jgi:hypothetical protein
MTRRGFSLFGVRSRVFLVALLGSAFLFINPLNGAKPALAYSPITGVTVSVTISKSVLSGDAVYAKAAVQGTGDYDHRVTWSLSPPAAGTVSPTGLFISGTDFTGTATIKATSVENPDISGTAEVIVSAGSDALHVDHNNAGMEDGTALHPYRTIQGALDHAVGSDTIKVAQGTYNENTVLPGSGVLLLGGFQGNSAANYAAGQPGDFVTRSTDHVSRVTIIQSPTRATPVVDLGVWGPENPLTYAVDGFTLTGGIYGIHLNCSGQIDFFISQNLITDNGVLDNGSSGGIGSSTVNLMALDNHITNNLSGAGGGLYVAGPNPFLIQGNVIDYNRCGGDFGGGVILDGSGLFTWNLVQNNQANLNSTYGYGGGLYVNLGPVELNRNSYSLNECKSVGGGILIGNGTSAILRHELIFRNLTTDADSGGAGIYAMPAAAVTMDHCTIAANAGTGTPGNGLSVRENAVVQVSNSIIWDNTGDQLFVYPDGILNLTYSDSQPYPGTGNLSVDPLFANLATDDYHLQSQRGRWDPATSKWVVDALQSACIDAGNPAAAFSQEPIPNGSRTNIGAYGNTPEASKSLKYPTTAYVLQLLLGG